MMGLDLLSVSVTGVVSSHDDLVLVEYVKEKVK
jgi:hypothetical protein